MKNIEQEQLKLEDFTKMTVKDFKEWLNLFDDEDNISLIVVDSNKRVFYKPGQVYPISDESLIIYDVFSEEPFDDLEDEIADAI